MGLIKSFLAVGIALVFVVFIGYALYVFYPPPKTYERNPCYQQYTCEKMFRQCQPQKLPYEKNSTIPFVPEPVNESCYQEIEQSTAYQQCLQEQEQCTENFMKTTERYKHARNSFFILWFIALLAIVSGSLLQIEGVSAGFIGGGILTLLYSLIYTAPYWTQASKYLKLAAIALVLGVLIYFGLQYNNQKSQRQKKQKPRKK